MKKALSLTLIMITFLVAMNASTKTSIKASDLPKAVLEDIKRNYPGYSIVEAYKVQNKSVVEFKVLIERTNVKLVLNYNKDGIFVRKSTITSLNKPVVVKPEKKVVPRYATKEVR